METGSHQGVSVLPTSGAVAAQPEATSGGYGEPTKPPDWRWLVTCDVFFNTLSTGLFLVAAVSELVRPHDFRAAARAAYPLALLWLVADLLCLVFDLGKPLRFHHMLRVFKPSSPMSMGTWCLVVYSVPLALAAVLSVTTDESSALEWLRILAVVAALVPAFGVAAYKGVLLSTSSQPGWRDGRWLGGYFTSSAFVVGGAELLILTIVMGRESAAASLRSALGVLLVLGLVPLSLLLVDLGRTPQNLYASWRRRRTAMWTVAGGALLPFCLVWIGSPPLLIVAAVCVLAAAIYLRLWIVMIPHGR